MLAWIENQVVRVVLGGALLLWLAGATLGVLVLILTTTVVMQGLLQPPGLTGRRGASRAGGSA